jgi:hypothetical protein
MSRKLFRGLAVLFVAAIPAVADETVHPTLRINPGLWEVVVTPQANGQLPIPAEQTAAMPANMRAKYMAAMQAMMARPSKMKECMTEEKLARGYSVGVNSARCPFSVVTNTASLMAIQATCPADEDGLQSMEARFQPSGLANVTGTVQMIYARAGKTITVDSTITGNWIGANCGGVKDVQVEQ